jgi:hypothetical protein
MGRRVGDSIAYDFPYFHTSRLMQEEHVESLARLTVSIYWLECGFRWWLNWQHHYECIMLSIFERRKIQHSLDDTAEIRRSSQLRLSPAREHGNLSSFVCSEILSTSLLPIWPEQ